MTMRIGIAGAGVMGRVLAWQLHQAGFQISLFDQDPIDHGSAAAYTAAGMLTPFCELESGEMQIYKMGMESLLLWPDIIDELGIDCGYQPKGSLVVAHRQDRADWINFTRQVKSKLAPDLDAMGHINHEQLKWLEPELSQQFQEASYIADEAWLCTHKTLKALADKLLEAGVQWHAQTPVLEVGPHHLVTESQNHRFDWVIDTRGLGAKPQWPSLRGVRGELIWLQAPEVSIKRLVRLMHPRYRLYLVPKGYDNLYVVGATQIESDDTGPMTVQSSLELLSAAYSLHTGFAQARIVDMRTNCRPALEDNLPRIEFGDGLIRVNGLYRHGFLLAPTVGQEVLSWLQSPEYHSAYDDLFQPAA